MSEDHRLTAVPGGKPKRKLISLVVDHETGEVVDHQQPKGKFMNGGHFMSVQKALQSIARDDTWTPLELRVFLELESRLDWENYLNVSISNLATVLNRSRQETSKALNALLRRGVIHRGPRVGNSYTYRLDPHIGWKGESAAQARAARDIAKGRWGMPQSAPVDVPGQLSIDIPAESDQLRPEPA